MDLKYSGRPEDVKNLPAIQIYRRKVITMAQSFSGITDSPVTGKDTDSLKNRKYAQGLINFIMNADTPITIGIQGGWGSGKTSLINMLKEGIKSSDDPENKAVCVMVNAWEHSLFTQGADKGEIAVSLLGGIILGIHTAIKDLETSGNPKIPTGIISDASENGQGTSKALAIVKDVGKFLFRAALVSQGMGGLVKSDESKPSDAEQTVSPPNAETVRELKDSLGKAVSSITGQTPYKRFVCFVDDLDRVQPQIAIEILDILKNIFDINGCIFVLAIDYDVVVKGLESKFGGKTKENEREFRQYFDKIIQIPFTMPVGSYKDHLRNFIEQFLQPLGFDLTESKSKRAIVLRDVAYWTTDGVPRSIKRIINTMSLLLSITKFDQEGNPVVSDNDLQGEDQQCFLTVIFIVVALHINYPEICRKLMVDYNFTGWNFEACQDRFDLSKDDFDYISKKKQGLYAADWQKVVYCLCAKTQWLKDRVESVLRVLMALNNILEPSDAGHAETDTTQDALEMLNKALSLVRVVSVDLDAVMGIDDSNVKKDRITLFFRQLHQLLKDRKSWVGLPDIDDECYATEEGDAEDRKRDYTVECEKGASSFLRVGFELYEATNTLSIAVRPRYSKSFSRSAANLSAIMKALEDRLGDLPSKPEAEEDGEWLYLYFKGYSKQSLADFDAIENVVSIFDKSLDLFRDALNSVMGK